MVYIDLSKFSNEKDILRGVLFLWPFVAASKQKEQQRNLLLFCRSGPTRTGDRFLTLTMRHPCIECVRA